MGKEEQSYQVEYQSLKALVKAQKIPEVGQKFILFFYQLEYSQESCKLD
jgi:hypothetical protein